MMRMKLLLTPAERAAFAEKFAERTANPLSGDFLRQAKAYGFVANGILIGGFLLNLEKPYRYVQMIPENHRKTETVQRYLAEGQAAELACMWLDRSSMTWPRRTRIYFAAIQVAILTGKRFIIAGSVTEAVAATHKASFRHIVYCGPTTFKGAPYGEIYAAKPYELILFTPFATAKDIATRLYRRRAVRSPRRHSG